MLELFSSFEAPTSTGIVSSERIRARLAQCRQLGWITPSYGRTTWEGVERELLF